MFFQVKQQVQIEKPKQHQPRCSLPESAWAGEGSLFLSEGEGAICSIGWKMLHILNNAKS